MKHFLKYVVLIIVLHSSILGNCQYYGIGDYIPNYLEFDKKAKGITGNSLTILRSSHEVIFNKDSVIEELKKELNQIHKNESVLSELSHSHLKKVIGFLESKSEITIKDIREDTDEIHLDYYTNPSTIIDTLEIINDVLCNQIEIGNFNLKVNNSNISKYKFKLFHNDFSVFTGYLAVNGLLFWKCQTVKIDQPQRTKTLPDTIDGVIIGIPEPVDLYDENFFEALRKELIIPKNSETGKVFVEFCIDTTGRMIELIVVKGVNYDLDNLVLSTIKNIDYPFNPVIKGGVPVKVRMVLPINIRAD